MDFLPLLHQGRPLFPRSTILQIPPGGAHLSARRHTVQGPLTLFLSPDRHQQAARRHTRSTLLLVLALSLVCPLTKILPKASLTLIYRDTMLIHLVITQSIQLPITHIHRSMYSIHLIHQILYPSIMAQ